MSISDFLVNEESTMIEAMKKLDTTSRKILFVQKNGELKATITDGDIRRWILSKGNLEARVRDIANYNPLYLEEDKINYAKEFMVKESIGAIPIVNKQKQIILIKWFNDFNYDNKSKIKLKTPVVIMAGGLGTRLYPYTKIFPKPLIPIGDIPIVEHIINKFCKYGVNTYYLIVNHKKNLIKSYFNELKKIYKVFFIDEKSPLGTGGGLSLLKDNINSTFILSNCDIIIEENYEDIVNYHVREKNLITMVCSLKNIKIPYGVVEISDTGELEKMKEKPDISFFTNTGMYVVEPKVIYDLEYNKKVDFTNIINKYKLSGEKIGVYPVSENSWLDMGQIDEMEHMIKKLEKNKYI